MSTNPAAALFVVGVRTMLPNRAGVSKCEEMGWYMTCCLGWLANGMETAKCPAISSGPEDCCVFRAAIVQLDFLGTTQGGKALHRHHLESQVVEIRSHDVVQSN